MLKQIVYEAFLRRWAVSHYQYSFLLKGSFLTRQYFYQRIPNDLDFVYLTHCDTDQIQSTVCAFLQTVTKIDVYDGVVFEDINQDDFWWNPEYEMADDFPTVTYSIKAKFNNELVTLAIDISFNLNLIDAPVAIDYKPYEGKPFTIVQSASVALQVAWKLHQTLVNPRHKDILDLTHLLPYIQTQQQRNLVWQTLEDECLRDNIDLDKNKLLFCEAKNVLAKTWHEVSLPVHPSYKLPKNFDMFWYKFSQALIFSNLI